MRDFYQGINGIKWSGDEGLCILLRRLAYPNRLCDLVPLFGRHETELSLIINVMLEEITVKHLNRLENITVPWVNHTQAFETFSSKDTLNRAVKSNNMFQIVTSLRVPGFHRHYNYNRYCGFCDGFQKNVLIEIQKSR